MSLVPRLLASVLVAAGGFTAVGLAAPGAADPDIDGESAAAVIDQLQEQGYAVNVNGAPAGDTSMLTTCTVTSIHNPGDPTPDPTSTTTIFVDVACPLTHG
ncbi:hypothetical protein [Mycolicibacterium hodleri]|uniref:PASTA domain-containing protein n=1 Tax=Mycolicibacterium hodleri TaxID=49897 RepID=A0A502E8J5_9MYCO|nr:hypothetical protein [Mycolicibacterium hodleri]TPG33202.1 hypothetical protein EAH80_17670 [Mycolicibacterium hodleri]